MADCGSDLQLQRAYRWIDGHGDGNLILLRHDRRKLWIADPWSWTCDVVPNCSCKVAGCDLTCKKFEVVTRSVGRIFCKGFTNIFGDGPKRIGP